jgi:hypothetical protein
MNIIKYLVILWVFRAARDHEHDCYNSLLPSAEVVHIHRESWSPYAWVNYSHVTTKVSR